MPLLVWNSSLGLVSHIHLRLDMCLLGERLACPWLGPKMREIQIVRAVPRTDSGILPAVSGRAPVKIHYASIPDKIGMSGTR